MTPTIPTLTPLPMMPSGGLLELVTTARALDDMVLSKPTRGVLDRVLAENRASAELLALGLRPANRLLFCGPPGCGKTVAAGAVAAALEIPLAQVRLDAVIGSHMGETAAAMRRVFDIAKHGRVVLFIDEADALGSKRLSSSDGAAGEARRVVNSLLVMLEEIRGPSLVIAATNFPDTLDPAMWRRFDEILMFPRPTGTEVATLMRRIIGRYRPVDAYVPARWSRKLTGFSFADAERIAFDIVKMRTLDASLDHDRAFRVAMERQVTRTALTKPRRK